MTASVPAVAARGRDVRPVGRYRWAPVQIEPLAGMSAALRDRRIVVAGGDDALGDAVVRALHAAGARPTRLTPSPGRAAADIVAQVIAAGGIPDGIVDLNVGEAFDPSAADAWEQPLALTVALLQACHDHWLAESRSDRTFYVAVTSMDGQMGFGGGAMVQPLGGLWAGLAKGLPRELPNCNIRVVDLDQELISEPARAAAAVCAELYRWGLFEVGRRGARRFTLAPTAAPAPTARVTLGPGDTVLMSGGGRGIGFALALNLAESFGCRVVVSGRSPAPNPDDPVIGMSEADFGAYRDRLLRDAAADRTLPTARTRLGRLDRDRAVHRNLDRARRAGADIQYIPCDVTDPTDVRRLLRLAGGAPAGVIHNAGIDVPARLPRKDWATVRDVVRVKVQGLLNLLAAFPGDAPPRFLCSVGSLTGRWGGMIGQLDYGAANEGLSRVGLWADRRPEYGGAPVTTVAWPTWDRLGMITNYQATLAYMSAMDVTDGIAHWKADLLGAEGGEVTFIGDVGPAVVPGLLRGYPAGARLPGIDRLRSTLAYLGEPVEFRPYRSLTSRVTLDLASMPAAADVTVRGRAMLPVSMCLEHLVAAAEWVRPGGADQLRLHELRDVEVAIASLAPRNPRLILTQTAEGSWDGPTWRVRVRLHAADRTVACAVASYQAAPDPGPQTEPPGAAGASPDGVPPDSLGRSGAAGLHWKGLAFNLAPWRIRPDGSWHADVGADRPEDLFLSQTLRPRAALGFTVIENLLRASALATPQALVAARLTIGRLALRSDSRAAGDDEPAHAAGDEPLERIVREPRADGDRWIVGSLVPPRIEATGVVFGPDQNPDNQKSTDFAASAEALNCSPL